MKKLSYLIVLILILGLALTGCTLLSNISQVPTTEKKPNEGGPFPPCTLVAGKNIDVGTMIVWNDADNLYVKYFITDPEWCLIETHLHVFLDDDDYTDVPQKNGNPIPGKFDYKEEHDCVADYTYTIPLEWGPETELFIAAHAVVKDNYSCYQTAVLYGIERFNGIVYGVDVLAGTSWVEFNIPDPPPAGSAGPNGLAYDAVNGRFYYCDYPSTTTLYFWDGTQQVAGLLEQNIAAADFYDSKYYYIAGKPPTDDLYVVEFNANGTIKTGFPEKVDDIADNAHGWTFNGDIAIKDDVVYGWGLCSTHGYEFFTYDLGTGDFSVNTVSYGSSLQLAFGSDGTLYGHRSGGAGAFYVVDTTNGDVTMVTPTPVPALLYTDCASGMICEPVTETAWGFGPGFPGKNWATYFIYTIQEPE